MLKSEAVEILTKLYLVSVMRQNGLTEIQIAEALEGGQK